MSLSSMRWRKRKHLCSIRFVTVFFCKPKNSSDKTAHFIHKKSPITPLPHFTLPCGLVFSAWETEGEAEVLSCDQQRACRGSGWNPACERRLWHHVTLVSIGSSSLVSGKVGKYQMRVTSHGGSSLSTSAPPKPRPHPPAVLRTSVCERRSAWVCEHQRQVGSCLLHFPRTVPLQQTTFRRSEDSVNKRPLPAWTSMMRRDKHVMEKGQSGGGEWCNAGTKCFTVTDNKIAHPANFRGWTHTLGSCINWFETLQTFRHQYHSCWLLAMEN